MRLLITALLFTCAFAIFAQDKPKELKTVPLSKTELLAVAEISRRQSELSADTNALMGDGCERAKIEVAVCSFDPQSKAWIEKPKEAPKAEAKK